MSVRDGLLAVLTLGPGYGLQLYSELALRSPHRRPVNVGQIYATLDRLCTAGLVEPAGSTADDLPLYRLTPSGDKAATAWMSDPRFSTLPEWSEMLDQVIITSSIRPLQAKILAAEYRRWWEKDLSGIRSDDGREDSAVEVRMARVAREAAAVAAIAWLGSAIATMAGQDSFRPLVESRPKRGRRITVRSASE